MFPLIGFISNNHATYADINFVDATNLANCYKLQVEESRCSAFKVLAANGKTSTGCFFGFTFHLSISHAGEIGDSTIALEIRGSISKDKAQLFEQQGFKFISTLKRNTRKES